MRNHNQHGCGRSSGRQENSEPTRLLKLEKLTGQKAVQTWLEVLSLFQNPRGCQIGCKVTLRRAKMYEFLDRLITIALLVCVTSAVLARNHSTVEATTVWVFKEQIVFPEIEYDKIDAIRGMDITITTSAKSNKEALLSEGIQFPFREKEVS